MALMPIALILLLISFDFLLVLFGMEKSFGLRSSSVVTDARWVGQPLAWVGRKRPSFIAALLTQTAHLDCPGWIRFPSSVFVLLLFLSLFDVGHIEADEFIIFVSIDYRKVTASPGIRFSRRPRFQLWIGGWNVKVSCVLAWTAGVQSNQ